MLDHVSLRVQDLSRAVAFYRTALAPIGYDVLAEYPGTIGMGADGKADLWISQTEQPLHPMHLAFGSDRDRIVAFHAAALSAGGFDNGAPGVRADYHPHYFAAFVRDPEGNNIEVVCHADPAAPKAKPVRAAARRSTRKPAKRAKPAARLTKKPAKRSPKAKPKKKRR